MLRNSLSKFFKKPQDYKLWVALVVPIWVLAGFILAQVIGGLVMLGLRSVGVSFVGVNESTLQAVFSAVIYVLSLVIVIGIPWWVKKYRTTRQEIGLHTSMTWTDILLTPLAFVAYILLSYVLTSIASNFPFYDIEQVQNTGFTQLTQGYEFLLAFLTLVVIAPVAEEILFRGYLLGKLRKHVPVWLAILVTSLLFGLVHFAWNVGVDVFALSIVLCLLRISTGRLWPAMLLHMAKNGLAFYLLFINPML